MQCLQGFARIEHASPATERRREDDLCAKPRQKQAKQIGEKPGRQKRDPEGQGKKLEVPVHLSYAYRVMNFGE